MGKKIKTRDESVADVAQGLYTMWKVSRPSRVEKFLNYINKSQTVSNDRELRLNLSETTITVSTIGDKVIFHSLDVKNTDIKVIVNKTFNLNDIDSKTVFIKEFEKTWRVAVTSLDSS